MISMASIMDPDYFEKEIAAESSFASDLGYHAGGVLAKDAPSVWQGKLARELGLEGKPVTREDSLYVMMGFDPRHKLPADQPKALVSNADRRCLDASLNAYEVGRLRVKAKSPEGLTGDETTRLAEGEKKAAEWKVAMKETARLRENVERLADGLRCGEVAEKVADGSYKVVPWDEARHPAELKKARDDLSSAPGGRRLGQDITYSTDKTIGIIYAAATPEERSRMRAIAKARVDEVMGRAIEDYARARTGKGGAVVVGASGMFATFVHEEARTAQGGADAPDANLHHHLPADIQAVDLHVHVAMPNISIDEEGDTRAMLTDEIQKHRKELDAEITAKVIADFLEEGLGAMTVDTTDDRGKSGAVVRVKVPGVTADMVDSWSPRTAAIKKELDARAQRAEALSQGAATLRNASAAATVGSPAHARRLGIEAVEAARKSIAETVGRQRAEKGGATKAKQGLLDAADKALKIAEKASGGADAREAFEKAAKALSKLAAMEARDNGNKKATLATRAAKGEPDRQVMYDEWGKKIKADGLTRRMLGLGAEGEAARNLARDLKNASRIGDADLADRRTLRDLTAMNVYFCESDLRVQLWKEAARSGLIGEVEARFQRITGNLGRHAQVVELGSKALDEIARCERRELDPSLGRVFVTEQGLAQERRFDQLAFDLMTPTRNGRVGKKGAISESKILKSIKRTEVNKTSEGRKKKPGGKDFKYREDQCAAAVRFAIGTEKLIQLDAPPGSGKTTMMLPVIEALKANGANIIELAPSHKAKSNIVADTGISAKDGHAIQGFVRKGCPGLNRHSVVIIDESSMIDLPDYLKLLEAVKKTQQEEGALPGEGAKIIAIGDFKQLQAVGRGAPFERASQVVPESSIKLTTITRQNDKEQLAAVQAFWDGDAGAYVTQIDALGQIDVRETTEDKADAMAAYWFSVPALKPEEKLFTAGTNADCARVNALIRDERVRRGQLSAEGVAFTAETALGRGRLELAPGDRVIFLAPVEVGEKKLADNSDTGTVLGIKTDRAGKAVSLKVLFDERGTADIPVSSKLAIDLAYTVTVHKSQGQTISQSAHYFSGGSTASANSLLVAGSRHREQYKLFCTPRERGLLSDVAQRWQKKFRAQTLAGFAPTREQTARSMKLDAELEKAERRQRRETRELEEKLEKIAGGGLLRQAARVISKKIKAGAELLAETAEKRRAGKENASDKNEKETSHGKERTGYREGDRGIQGQTGVVQSGGRENGRVREGDEVDGIQDHGRKGASRAEGVRRPVAGGDAGPRIGTAARLGLGADLGRVGRVSARAPDVIREADGPRVAGSFGPQGGGGKGSQGAGGGGAGRGARTGRFGVRDGAQVSALEAADGRRGEGGPGAGLGARRPATRERLLVQNLPAGALADGPIHSGRLGQGDVGIRMRVQEQRAALLGVGSAGGADGNLRVDARALSGEGGRRGAGGGAGAGGSGRRSDDGVTPGFGPASAGHSAASLSAGAMAAAWVHARAATKAAAEAEVTRVAKEAAASEALAKKNEAWSCAAADRDAAGKAVEATISYAKAQAAWTEATERSRIAGGAADAAQARLTEIETAWKARETEMRGSLETVAAEASAAVQETKRQVDQATVAAPAAEKRSDAVKPSERDSTAATAANDAGQARKPATKIPEAATAAGNATQAKKQEERASAAAPAAGNPGKSGVSAPPASLGPIGEAFKAARTRMSKAFEAWGIGIADAEAAIGRGFRRASEVAKAGGGVRGVLLALVPGGAAGLAMDENGTEHALVIVEGAKPGFNPGTAFVAREKDGKLAWQPTHTLHGEAARAGRGGAIAEVLARAGKQSGNMANGRDALGMTGLHVAAERGHADVARAFIDGGADPAAKDFFGRTPAMLAAGSGAPGAEEAARVVREACVRKTAPERADQAPRDANVLAAAPVAGKPLTLADIVRQVEEAEAAEKAELARKAQKRLDRLCRYGNPTGMAIFDAIRDGADPNKLAADGLSPLQTALIYNAKVGAIGWLLDAGANPAQAATSGFTALHMAASQRPDVLNILIDHVPSAIDVTDTEGQTALHFAAFHGKPEAVGILLAAGAAVDVRTANHAKTALHMACEKGHTEIVRKLLESGGDPRIPASDGRTPFMVAKNKDIMGMLAANGGGPQGVAPKTTAPRPQTQKPPAYGRK